MDGRGARAAAGIAGVALGLLAGTALQLQQPTALAPPALAAGVLVAALLGLCAAVAARGAARRAARGAARAAAGRGAPAVRLALLQMLVPALAAGAASWAGAELRLQQRLAEALAPGLEGQDLRVTGTVSSLPRESLQGVRFDLEVEQALWRGEPVTVPPRVSLGWWRGPDGDALLAGPPQPVRAGQRWQFTLRLRQPHGPRNPHGFDLELWLWEQGVRATGAVRARQGVADDAPVLLHPAAAHPVERARQAVRDGLQARVGDASAAGVLAALAVGDQAAIDRDDWERFRITGVAHLMAISGLHVTLFAWLAGRVVAAGWRRRGAWVLACPAPVAARWAGVAAALAYSVLAGWGVPAQRTVGLLLVLALVRQAGAHWPFPLALLVAGAVVVGMDPWAMLQPGFWLSFVAVAVLFASEPVQRPAAQRLAPATGHWLHDAAPQRLWPGLRQAAAAALRTQLVATVALAPLSLLFFQQLSVVGLVANLLAIPWVTLLVTPLALAGVLVPPLWSLAALLVQAMMAVLDALASWPGAQWHAAAAPGWAVAAGLGAGVLAVAPLPWRLRLLAVPLLVPLLWPAVPRPPHGAFELLAADVGQGTAVLVQTRHHTLLYDTGPRTSAQSDAGSRLLVPMLHALGERRLDVLMLSHRDTDHVGGADAVARALPVQRWITGLEPGHPLREAAPRHQPCVAGLAWQWDGVHFELLHPGPDGEPTGPARSPSNARSCVLQVRSAPAMGGTSALLTGDIEAAQEAALVARLGPALRSTVLVVPHHGSATSSSPAFLDAVAPQVAVVQAAYRSRFGHPAPVVLQRLAERPIALLRSDRCGAWRWRSDAPLAGHCEREQQRRPWHHPQGPRGRVPWVGPSQSRPEGARWPHAANRSTMPLRSCRRSVRCWATRWSSWRWARCARSAPHWKTPNRRSSCARCRCCSSTWWAPRHSASISTRKTSRA